MKIKNLAAKVIGIGSVQIYPGSEYIEVPDALVYVPVFNKNGEKTGEKEILPSLRALERLNQIVIIETPAPQKQVVETVIENDEPVEENPQEEEKPAPKKKARAKKSE